MKSRGLIVGAAVILITNAMLVWSVSRNRAGGPVTTLELTERELRLEENLEDNAGLTLRLRWESTASWRAPSPDPNPWFNAAKLAELGFDCHIPPEDPAAESFYRGVPARPAWVALELKDHGAGSRLVAMDVARDPETLRRRYADKPRLLIAAGTVRLFRDPQLRGTIQQLLIQEITLPRPYSQTLESIKGGPSDRYLVNPDARPRYAVTLAWGASFEPWVTGCRLLSPGETN